MNKPSNEKCFACLTAPGAGAGFRWSVCLNGFCSPFNERWVTSYARPVLTGFNGGGTVSPLVGLKDITIEGKYMLCSTT